MNAATIVASLLAFLVAQAYLHSYWKSRSYKHRLFVPGVPVFGNTFQVPPVQQGHGLGFWQRNMEKCKLRTIMQDFLKSKSGANMLSLLGSPANYLQIWKPKLGLLELFQSGK